MSKQKDWSEKDMLDAMNGVNSGLSIRKSAEQYHVPQSMLLNYLHRGKPSNPGVKATLNPSDEE